MGKSLAIVAAALFFCSPAHAEERHYLMLFGSGSRPRASHSFAVFFKARFGDEDDGAKPTSIEYVTVSWYPASGRIRLLARPALGANVSFLESINWARREGVATVGWGPFEVNAELYHRGVMQSARLRSGATSYKALDRRFRTRHAINCIHAVSDVVPGPLLHTGTRCGVNVLPALYGHYRPYIRSSGGDDRWLLAYLETTQGFVVQGPGRR